MPKLRNGSKGSIQTWALSVAARESGILPLSCLTLSIPRCCHPTDYLVYLASSHGKVSCFCESRRSSEVSIPYHTIPYHTIPYHTIPYHTIPYHTIPYHTIPYHTIPYHTIPYHTIPYHFMFLFCLEFYKLGRYN